MVFDGWREIRLCRVARRPMKPALLVAVHPRRRAAAGVVFAGAQFNINLLPQGLFIPCFLQFAILQVRRTSSPVLGVEHSWARYRFHIAQRLRSTVPVVCRLPRYQPFWRPLPILLDFQCAFLRKGACLSTQHIPHCFRCTQLSRPYRRVCRCCSAGCRYPRNHFS